MSIISVITNTSRYEVGDDRHDVVCESVEPNSHYDRMTKIYVIDKRLNQVFPSYRVEIPKTILYRSWYTHEYYEAETELNCYYERVVRCT